MYKIATIIIFVFVLLLPEAKAQVPTVQDCMAAIPICRSVYFEENAYQNTGNYPNEISSTTSCLSSGEVNDVWYVFTVVESGNLSFNITPNDLNDDYDWAVFNLTMNPCADIFNNSTLEVSCNYSGEPGITGPNGYGGDNNEPVVQVYAGQTYVINVSQFSPSINGYKIEFGESTALIYDNEPPALRSTVGTNACGTDKVTVSFTENVQCATVEEADFVLTGPAGVYDITNISSPSCEVGASYGMTYILTFSPVFEMGDYTLLFDANASGSVFDNCENTAPTNSIDFQTQSPIDLVSGKNNITCHDFDDGTITITPSNTYGDVLYSIDDGVNFLDNGGVFTGLTADSYYVMVTDDAGCPATSNVITIANPDQLSFSSIEVEDVVCHNENNGTIATQVVGGTGSNRYSLDGSTFLASPSFTSLADGNYVVEVKDVNNCTISSETVEIKNPPALEVTDTILTNLLCHNDFTGSLQLFAQGGTGNVEFSLDGATPQNNGLFGGLSAGNYQIVVTDSNNCTVPPVNLVVTEPDTITLLLSGNDILCHGDSTGNIQMNVSGGTLGYNYLWSNGSESEDLTDLPSGEYSVIMQDANNCEVRDTIELLQPETPVSFLTASKHLKCKHNTNGEIVLSVEGGTPDYSFLWSTGSVNQSINNLPAGVYEFQITDAHGCVYEGKDTVYESTFSFNNNTTKVKNVNCYAGNDGEINLSMVGGDRPFEFVWSDGSQTEDLQNLIANTYYVVAIDTNGCRIDTSFVVSEPDAPLTTYSIFTNVKCRHGRDGTIDLSVSGGVEPYYYEWSNTLQSEDIEMLTAGEYIVEVKDANRCIIHDTIVIAQPDEVLAVEKNQTNVLCYGEPTGAIDLYVSGGISGYSFLWSNGAITEDIVNVVAGEYLVEITDANGCVKTDSIEINQPQFPVLYKDLAIDHVKCFGENNGAVNMNISGGSFPYDIYWSTNDTTESIDTLVAGEYSLQIIDANSCQYDTTFIIAQPALPLALDLDVNHVSCFGGHDARIELNVTGGTSDYEYLWANGQTTNLLEYLSADTFSVVVVDANGCQKKDTVIITQSDTLVQLEEQVVNVSCKNGNDGEIRVVASGGEPPYTYNWSNGATQATITSLSVGEYTLEVADQNGCMVIETFTVNQPAFPIEIVRPNLYNINCYDGNDGSIEISIDGGSAPFSFNWSNGATTEDVTGLYIGSYQVVVVDANLCVDSADYTLTQPDSAVILSFAVTNVACNGGSDGSIDMSVEGGVRPYDYLWSNNATTQDIMNLSEGLYTATVTDANGCVTVDSRFVNESVILSFVEKPVNCHGGTDGSLNLSVYGGIPSYSYVWSTGAITQDIYDLPAGEYSVTVTDNSGCVEMATGTITEPAYDLSIVQGRISDVNCRGGNDGEIELFVGGGTEPYFYSWSNNDKTKNVDSLTIGQYHVFVTDTNGCKTDTFFVVSQPDSVLELQLIPENISCHNEPTGKVFSSVAGGTRDYFYQWSNGETTPYISSLTNGTYSLIVTDKNGCTKQDSIRLVQPNEPIHLDFDDYHVNCKNDSSGFIDLTVSGGSVPYEFLWSNGETTEDVADLKAGVYDVFVTDGNGCVRSNYVVIEQPTFKFKIANSQITDVDCFDQRSGSILLMVTGGIKPYEFTWSTGSKNENLYSIKAGSYTILAVDANLCTFDSTFVVTQPDLPLDLELIKANNLCSGNANGTIDISVSGGVLPYNYLWSNGEKTQNINSLTSGEYSVLVTDENNCTISDTVEIIEPAPIVSQNTKTDILCFGGTNGAVNLSVSGGLPPYNYLWSNGAQSPGIFGLEAGYYTVAITDNNLCAKTDTIIILQPFELQLFPSVYYSCHGAKDGSIDLEILGGILPYDIRWSTDETTPDIQNLLDGRYDVTIRDANNCLVEQSIEVVEPEELDIAPNIVPASCDIVHNGSVELNVQGGTSPYLVVWTDFSTDNDFLSDLQAGVYPVEITDSHDCKIEKELEIEILYETCFEIVNSFTPNDDGINDTWIMSGIELFPEAVIEVFDRFGKKVASLRANSENWDGTFNGKPLPMGTYYYIINLNNPERKPVSGTISIIR